MTSVPLRSLLPLAALLVLSAARAQTPANCPLANAVDATSYDRLTIDLWSEADQDNASYNWAECRAAKLSASLAGMPQLRARIATLRGQFRELRDLESELAGIRAGGGTMYSHAVPRSFAPLEDQLASLAALASGRLGAQTGQQYARTVQEARQNNAEYIKTLRAYKPGADETYGLYDPKEWARMVNRYETLSKAVMLTLGSRGDAATALGYSILVDQVFPAKGE
ncbi:hypothetical protein [Deinococcus apachensis]|uniref:hypothetical protein n=1 Tax=Deinococcus apachensis TaxID=309886 RepID=UPI00036E1A0B|nr:hypothetical protein [Deinococcus apachensis]